MVIDPGDAHIARVLARARRIAVVGLSVHAHRASHDIAGYLQRHGYHVVGVNPIYAGKEAAGAPIVATLAEAGTVDIVDVFRRAHDVGEYVDQVLAMDDPPPVFWMQLGIRNDAEAGRLAEGGVTVVQDRCIKVEHRRLR